MITALVISPQPDEPLQLVELDERDSLSYRQIVAGDLEAVEWTEPPATMYVDEHGKLDRRPTNLRATVLWWIHNPAVLDQDILVGPVLVVGPLETDGYDTGVPSETVDLLMHTDAYRVAVHLTGDPGWHASSATYGDWLEAYTAAVHTARQIGSAGTVRVVAAETFSRQQPPVINPRGSAEPRTSLPQPGITGGAPATVQVSLEIENRYEDDVVLYTRVTDVLVPAPPADAGDDELHDWALEHLFPFTGTGRTAGDSWYDVTVTASSDPRLLDAAFHFGY